MQNFLGKRSFFTAILCALLFNPLSVLAVDEMPGNKINPVISASVFEEAKQNQNWKLALITGKEAQVVLMNITPETNPKNEIGMETHEFDQVILVAEGNAKSILNGKESTVKAGDMIFIPQNTPHNFINLSANKPFKIISIYSRTDIPAGAVYKKSADTPQE